MDPLILFVPEKKGNNEKKINNDVICGNWTPMKTKQKLNRKQGAGRH